MKKHNILFYIYLFLLFLPVSTVVNAQDNDWVFEERNVISLYWTTLDQKEKKITDRIIAHQLIILENTGNRYIE